MVPSPRVSLPFVAAITLVLGLACGPLQTYGQGMRVICDSAKTCPDCATAAPDEKAMRLAEHIASNLWNRQATDVFKALAMVDPEMKGKLLQQAADEAGIGHCDLADTLADFNAPPPDQAPSAVQE